MGVIFCDALRDLVPFAQFKKREKHPLVGFLLLVKLQLQPENCTL